MEKVIHSVENFFHSVEVPDFSPQRTQGSRAATESFDPLTQKAQETQKERKRRSEQPVLAQRRGDA
jgi:hypothetical protein